MDVVARDRGQPSKSTKGVLEIHVGEDKQADSLRFQNSTYFVDLEEQPPLGKEIVQVQASKTKYSVSYSLIGEDDDFEIHPQTGVIKVINPKTLDYESNPRLKLIVVAQANNNPPLFGYANVVVNLLDKNDNAPHFTQERYVSSVWEGNNKGTFVTQVTASDNDRDGNGNIVYHVIEGNHDNAFVIDPPFSGIVKTNIVLDREIRDAYHLTIIAVDDGTPQLTGTCTLVISIVDVNDNQPVFPPHSIVSISEGAEVGTVVTTITANDVDTNPTLIYSFTYTGNPTGHFSIDRFSGQITLSQPLDHEIQDKFELQIQASDGSHVAETSVTVHVTDINDNPPVFSQQSYEVTLPELVEPGNEVVQVSAADKDSGINAQIIYSMNISPVDGFYIDAKTGTIFTNTSIVYDPMWPFIQLVVTARDMGKPSLTAVAAVRVQITDVNTKPPKFAENLYTTHISEDAPRGSTLLQVSAVDDDESRRNNNIDYSIIGGNVGESFIITGITGEIVLVKELDREEIATYSLKVAALDRGAPALNATTEVMIYVDDVNDHPPLFGESLYEHSVSETASVGTVVLQVSATDKDDNQQVKITYDITSGNAEGKFNLDKNKGILTISKPLDYEETPDYKFIVRASDNDPLRPLSALSTVVIKVQDENDNTPHFPLKIYTEFIEENAPVGTSVFTAHAIDADCGIYGKLNYTIGEEGTDKFRVDLESGTITTAVVFDYESKARYFFTLMAVDPGNRYATVQVQVDIESRDEYPPEFSQSTYKFSVPADAPVGFTLGQVHATDKDEGADGKVMYHFRSTDTSFSINGTSGVIMVQGKLKQDYTRRKKRETLTKDVSLFVVASSGRVHSLTSMAVVEVTIDFSPNASLAGATEEKLTVSLPGWGLGLVISLAILAIALLSLVFLLRLHTKRSGKPPVIRSFDNSFDTIAIRHPPSSSSSISQYPPHYNDISQFDSTQHITSEVSDQSHSASSGRGSAEEGEDVEDEEIRMINEGPLLQQQKLQCLGLIDPDHDDDNISDISVHNTQEYLARLGINTTQSDFGNLPCAPSVESMHMFDEEGGGEGVDVDISNLIYSKLHEVGDEENDAMMDGTRTFGFGDEGEPSMTGSLSSIVHSEEELTGSYNWDYLLDWGPQYQPLAHVFAEIARLKDDSMPPPYMTGPLKKTLNPQVKTLPPPLLTNVAPRSIAPVALSTGHTSQVTLPSLPRSPISHESTFSSPAMSPSFSPSLSPLATRSPSISPLSPVGGGGLPIAGLGLLHRSQRPSNVTGSSGSEAEVHI